MKTLRLVTLFGICLFLKASLLKAEEANPAKDPAKVSDTKVTVTEAPVVTTANGVRVETKLIESQAKTSHEATPAHAAKHFQGSSETKIENNITIDGRGLAYGAIPAAAAPAVVSAVAQEVVSSRPISITPIAGITGFQGVWYSNMASRGTVGLILDIPLVSVLSLEAEGQYSRFSMRNNDYYSQPLNQYTGGANAKITLGRGLIQPYVGAGMMAVYYEGLNQNQANQNGSYLPNRTIGAGQVVAGADLNLFGVVAIGARGEYVRPMTNLPPRNGYEYSSLGGGVSSPLTADFYRILGTVKVSF